MSFPFHKKKGTAKSQEKKPLLFGEFFKNQQICVKDSYPSGRQYNDGFARKV